MSTAAFHNSTEKITNAAAFTTKMQTSRNTQYTAICVQKKITWSHRFLKIKLQKEQRKNIWKSAMSIYPESISKRVKKKKKSILNSTIILLKKKSALTNLVLSITKPR